MDAILEAPIGVVIEKLSFDPEIKAQFLRGRAGDRTPLSAIYDLMLAREAGCWEKANSLGKELNLSLYFINKTYNEAMRWAHDVTPLRFAPISRMISSSKTCTVFHPVSDRATRNHSSEVHLRPFSLANTKAWKNYLVPTIKRGKIFRSATPVFPLPNVKNIANVTFWSVRIGPILYKE